MFLHSLVVQQRSHGVVAPDFEARLRQMFGWIAALADEDWKLPHLGDCDNGRVELLADDIAQAAILAGHSLRVGSLCRQASHLLQISLRSDGEDRKSISLLSDSGIAVLRSGEASVVFVAMPNGLLGKGSHTHCDKLSVVFRLGPDEVFCDSGSRCYTRSAEQRNLDRSTIAHNTLAVDGADQNIIPTDPGLLFRCGNEAAVSRIEIPEAGETAASASHQGYSRFGIEHQRTVRLTPCSLEILDEVSGTGRHLLELRYILGPEWRVSSEIPTGKTVSCVLEGTRRLTFQCEAADLLTLSVLPAEISREYGASLSTNCIQVQTTASLPAKVQTRVGWE
jgi:hypothetical protein